MPAAALNAGTQTAHEPQGAAQFAAALCCSHSPAARSRDSLRRNLLEINHQALERGLGAGEKLR